ncbi:MAG: sugar phosphate isomerase/epimerase [Armatimonadetes bacterium]|nr:sugar phosphate isomerase/epimerase [Armatimonadota bacterium]
MAHLPIALQMYTVRDQTAVDFAGTYRKVAEMGYEGVEIAGDGGLSAHDMKQLLDDCGFARCGSHIMLQAIEDDLQKVVDYNLEIHNPWIVVPWLPAELRADADGWRSVAGRMEEAGGWLAEMGLTLCYHNHAFEFEVEENGAYGLDILYANARPGAVQAELDLYWVKYGGQDPAEYVTRYRDRAPLLHIKDMTASEPHTFTEVGTGIIDWPVVVKAAEGGVAAAWIIEQDTCQRPSLDSAKISLDNFRQILER